MSNFDDAIPVILGHEGTDTNFWVNDPLDAGGETVWGISMLMIKREGLQPVDLGLSIPQFTPGCLKAVTKETCKKLYKRLFWDRFGYGTVQDTKAATKIFDSAVNMGPSRAAKLAQAALVSLGKTVAVDGNLGPKSIAAINQCDPQEFVNALGEEMKKFYLAIVQAKPSQNKFLRAWLKRARWGVQP